MIQRIVFGFLLFLLSSTIQRKNPVLARSYTSNLAYNRVVIATVKAATESGYIVLKMNREKNLTQGFNALKSGKKTKTSLEVAFGRTGKQTTFLVTLSENRPNREVTKSLAVEADSLGFQFKKVLPDVMESK